MIFPNPSSGSFEVQHGDFKHADIEVFNYLGTQVFKTNYSGRSMKIDTQLQAGLYTMVVRDNGKVADIRKILIIR